MINKNIDIGDIVLLKDTTSGNQWKVTSKSAGEFNILTPFNFYGGKLRGVGDDDIISLMEYRDKQLEELI